MCIEMRLVTSVATLLGITLGFPGQVAEPVEKLHQLPDMGMQEAVGAPDLVHHDIVALGVYSLVVPRECFPGRSEVDLLVHFHGVAQALQQAANDAQLDAAILVVNHGVRSTTYSESHGYPTAAEQLRTLAAERVSAQCGRRMVTRRLALSCWSAGCAAVSAMLERREIADDVEAALFADGMHAPFELGFYRKVHPMALTGVVNFARRAVRGEKLFSLTCSNVDTEDYASTRESAAELLTRLRADGTELQEENAEDLADGASARTRSGQLSVTEYPGEDKAAHVAQLRSHFAPSLLGALSERWSRE